MTRIVDLRSDTVTRPRPEMRRVMAAAEVGDDVFGDDPTVNLLEQSAASLLGKAAAIFVPSGTMGNLVALSSLTVPGDELILERQCHIFNHEVASVPALAGVQFNVLDGDRGVIQAEQIAPHIRPRDLHAPVTRAISIENTHNRGGGHVFPLEEMRRVKRLAEENDLKVHLDGARLSNAVVASGVSFRDYAACADTVSMCFSKGLGAPAGSIVAGSAETIRKTRKKRKQLGGGMRQTGILAAAALYALDNHIDRLAEDHANARRLGEIIDGVDGLDLVFPVDTNMVVIRVGARWGSREAFLGQLEAQGVRAGTSGSLFVRLVTHLDVDATDIDRVAEVLEALSPV